MSDPRESFNINQLQSLRNLNALVSKLANIADSDQPNVNLADLANQWKDIWKKFNSPNGPDKYDTNMLPEVYQMALKIQKQIEDSLGQNEFYVNIPPENNIPVKMAFSINMGNIENFVSHKILYSKEDIAIQDMFLKLYTIDFNSPEYNPKHFTSYVILAPELKPILADFLKEATNTAKDIKTRHAKNPRKCEEELQLLRSQCTAFLNLLNEGNQSISRLEAGATDTERKKVLSSFHDKIVSYEKAQQKIPANQPPTWKKFAHATLVAAGALLGCVIGAAAGLTVGALAVGGAGSVIPVFGNIGGAIAGGSAGAVIGAIKGAGLGVVIATAAASSILGMAAGVAAHKAHKLDSERTLFTQPKKNLSRTVDKTKRENRPGK